MRFHLAPSQLPVTGRRTSMQHILRPVESQQSAPADGPKSHRFHCLTRSCSLLLQLREDSVKLVLKVFKSYQYFL